MQINRLAVREASDFLFSPGSLEILKIQEILFTISEISNPLTRILPILEKKNMTLQDRFDTALSLLLQHFEFTQKKISEHLADKNIANWSESSIARAKSEIDRHTGYKTHDGELSGRQLEPLVEALENLLEAKGVELADDKSHYLNRYSGEIHEYVFKDKIASKAAKNRDGLIDIHSRIPRKRIQDMIRKAVRVRLLQTFMTSMEDYAESMQECLKKGGHIQILLMDPRGRSAGIRTRSLKHRSGDVEEKVFQNLHMLEEIDPGGGQLEIRFYDDFPGMELYAIDDRLFCGWYLFHQFAKDGGYLELIDNNHFTLPKNFNRNWESLWQNSIPVIGQRMVEPTNGQDVSFRCHYLRQGNYRTFEMVLNRFTERAVLRKTPSGEMFKGFFENEQGRFLSIWTQTDTQWREGRHWETNKRIASFLIYTEANGIWSQPLSVGVFTNVAPNGMLYANILLIERQTEEGFTQKEEYLSLIKKFLAGMELQAEDINYHNFFGLERYIRQKFPGWERKNARIAILAGSYHLFFQGEDEWGKPCIYCRQLWIDPETLKARRAIWGENRQREYEVLFPDKFHLLFTSITEEIMDAELLFLRRVGRPQLRFGGQMVVNTQENRPLSLSAYLVRNDADLAEEEQRVALNSPQYKRLCERYPEFHQFFGPPLTSPGTA